LAWGYGSVDEGVDVTNEREVVRSVATRMQADRDVFVIPNAMGAILDPSSRAGTTAKLGIDATRPRPDFPPRLTLPDDALRRARAIMNR
jgi:3-polyprenyl-4-hydroxybenzoate decarboxylase